MEQTGLQLNTGSFLSGFLDFLVIFQEAILALRVFNMLSVHINSLGKNLAVNWFVYNGAISTLGGILDSAVLPRSRLRGTPF